MSDTPRTDALVESGASREEIIRHACNLERKVDLFWNYFHKAHDESKRNAEVARLATMRNTTLLQQVEQLREDNALLAEAAKLGLECAEADLAEAKRMNAGNPETRWSAEQSVVGTIQTAIQESAARISFADMQDTQTTHFRIPPTGAYEYKY
jgi:hypothetical protein